MSAMPSYIDRRINDYLRAQEEAENAAFRLEDRTKVELADTDTWELGISEAIMQEKGKRNPILDAFMAGDTAQAGYLIDKYVREVYATEQARQAIEKADREWDA